MALSLHQMLVRNLQCFMLRIYTFIKDTISEHEEVNVYDTYVKTTGLNVFPEGLLIYSAWTITLDNKWDKDQYHSYTLEASGAVYEALSL